MEYESTIKGKQHRLISETAYWIKVLHKTVCIIWCHLYKILKQAKWFYGGKKSEQRTKDAFNEGKGKLTRKEALNELFGGDVNVL